MNKFLSCMDEEISGTSVTENGALGFKSSGTALVDLNFAVSSLRGATDDTIVETFVRSFNEDYLHTIVWLFFCRDIRGGLGERRIFRVCMKWLCENAERAAFKVISFIPEYGRWDDAIDILTYNTNDEVRTRVLNMIETQLKLDEYAVSRENHPVSLLAKWMPSENASSKESRKMARFLALKLDKTPEEYRKLMSKLRKRIGIVESRMSSNQWGDIKYESVPSRASMIYSDAFKRHDPVRYSQFIEDVNNDQTKINAGTLYPYEIYHEYMKSYRYDRIDRNPALEAMWKNLPSSSGGENVMVVVDGSGSMYTGVGGTSVRAIEVSRALGIFFAERQTGEYHNTFITFSSHPQLIRFGDNFDLRDKISEMQRHNDCSNTNIESVFNLILKTACDHKLKQEDLPKAVLIISDMEFDDACYPKMQKYLFDIIAQDYEDNGYKLPRLVFWNVCSRTHTIPVRQNELGVALISGFSGNIFDMVVSGKTDPYDCLIEKLESERYQPVLEAIEQ